MLRTIASLIAKNLFLWKIYYHLIWKPAIVIRQARKNFLYGEILKRLKTGDDTAVNAGPFQGLHYAILESHCSTLLPKLLGTYEAELQSTILSWKEQNFPIIVDIGCAEGYYAIGLALMFPNASVFAYDISEKARNLTKSMAIKNLVSDRLTVRGACESQDLLAMDLSSGGLIFSDCEGYELELFDRRVAEHLQNCHLVIEMHDRPHKNFFVRLKLEDIFSNTHNIKIINSIDDFQKIKTYHSPLVTNYDD
ncbi:MAG: hypothetical protein F6K53_38030, partial [Moorea sp. SIO4A1]|uniref:hypothetical protein n=1 Tax=Moorena sp. SIO4A1 TaxID=2607835 RepID=UPI00144FBA67